MTTLTHPYPRAVGQAVIRALAAVVLLVACALLLSAPAINAETLALDARALYERSVTRDVRLSGDGTAVELGEGELFEDDGPAAGYSYEPNEEDLSRGAWIRKELLIPHPGARRATFLVAPGGALRAVINGAPCDLGKPARIGNYWQAYSLDPAILEPGENTFVLHGAGKLWIARDEDFPAGSEMRTRHPNRSARSRDGGTTWDYEHLGQAGNVDGEYYVRLFLDRYRSRGRLILPVIDAGNLTGEPIAPPVRSVGPIRIAALGETATAGRILARARTGASFAPAEDTWSDWQDLGANGGTLRSPSGRYLQVEIELATADPLETPPGAGGRRSESAEGGR